MTTQQILFYIFAALSCGCGFMVITQNNPVRAVLFLVAAFFATAAVWLMAQAEFLALVLILVYVGAVMTLFLFVIMMLHVEADTLKKHFVKYLPVGVLVAGLLLVLMFVAIKPGHFAASHLAHGALQPEHFSNTKRLGGVLYTTYAYPFELAAVLLLVAIIASISLAHRKPQNCKKQEISQQVKVRREQRVRLVDMPVEKS